MKKSEFDIIFRFGGKTYRAYTGGLMWGLIVSAQAFCIAAVVYAFVVIAILLG